MSERVAIVAGAGGALGRTTAESLSATPEDLRLAPRLVVPVKG
jgi:hypothetical protein